MRGLKDRRFPCPSPPRRYAAPPVIAPRGTDEPRANCHSGSCSLRTAGSAWGAAAPSTLQCSDAVVFPTPAVSTTDGRTELQTVLEFLRPGDVLMVSRLDRLARSIGDLQDIVRISATMKATEQPFNTGDIYGELTVNLLGCFAQFETALRKERQLEGIAKAKAEGVYKGRKPSVDVAQVRALKAQGVGPASIAKTLGIGGASVYRALVT